jgi:hypothetical protein
MVWCGFDESMRSGIVLFATGVARAISEKATLRGVKVSDQLERERFELQILEELIENRLENGSEKASGEARLRLKAFGGMVSIARFFIERTQVKSLRPDEVPNFCPDAHSLGSLIKQFEEEYERQPVERRHEEKVVAALSQIFDSQPLIPSGALSS